MFFSRRSFFGGGLNHQLHIRKGLGFSDMTTEASLWHFHYPQEVVNRNMLFILLNGEAFLRKLMDKEYSRYLYEIGKQIPTFRVLVGKKGTLGNIHGYTFIHTTKSLLTQNGWNLDTDGDGSQRRTFI